MGLARIAIAVLAVVLAFGLLILGGISLWGALTSKDSDGKSSSAASSPSSAANTGANPPPRQVGNSIVIRCLAPQCQVFVGGPGPNDVLFNGNLPQNVRRVFTGTHLVVSVQDASAVSVTVNGKPQPRGRRGEAKTYEVPAEQ
jgi:hypothetical protein